MALQEELEVQGNKLFRYRSHLPLILLVVSIPVFIYTQLYNNQFAKFISYDAWEIIAFAVCLLGLLVRVYTVGYTPKNTSGRNTAQGQVADVLNTRGIYSMVRHPLYVGNFFMWLGIAMLVQDAWYIIAFIFIYWVYYERIMFAEEQFLRGKFGQKYVDWSMTAPAFIPSFKNYNGAELTFSWKKVIKKEKNGIAAIFVVFLLFRFIRDYMLTGELVLDSWQVYATVISVVIYFILKIFKKYTKVFDEEGR